MIYIQARNSPTFGDLIMQVHRNIDCLYMRRSIIGIVAVSSKNVPNTDDCSNKAGWLSYTFNIDHDP